MSISKYKLTKMFLLTIIHSLQITNIQYITKKLQNKHKKNTKKRTMYKKNAYLCNVLINNDCFTD